MMERQPNTIGSLFENAGDYLETRLDLLKLQAIHKSSDVTSSIISRVTIIVLIAFGIFILNIGIALWIGELLGKSYWGFFVIAGFYCLVGLILHIFRNSILKEPISSMIIKKMLN